MFKRIEVEQSREVDAQFLLLQINDALFPSGAYAHSYGLETYIQQELVYDRASAQQWMNQYLRVAVLYSGLLPVRLAYEAAAAGDIPRLKKLEERMYAAKSAAELRMASEKLGNRLVKTIHSLSLTFNSDIFARYTQSCRHISHAVAYGVICAVAAIEKPAALTHYLYAQTSGMVTTCVKAVPLSQTDGQRMLIASQPVFAEVLHKVENCGMDKLCLAAPAFDIRAMQHENLYSRLYMS